jgi:Rod binding domain-containing protein
MDSGLSLYTDKGAIQSALSAHAPKKATNLKGVDAAAQDFEAMFVSNMMAPMWQTVETDGEFDGGSAEETFRSMLINEYGKNIAKNGGLGFAPAVKAEMLRIQEAS